MNKFSKNFIISAIIIALLVIITSIIINIFINKDNIKNIIAKQFYAKTNYNIDFKGNFTLKIFPFLGVTADNIIITDPKLPNSTPLANIGKTKIKMHLLPLLHRKISIAAITLNNLTLNVYKENTNKNTQNIPSANKPAQTTIKNIDTIKQKNNIDLEINNINISNITINFLDKDETTKLVIDNLQTDFKMHNNTITLAHTIAALYKGKLQAQTFINLKTPKTYAFKANLKNFAVHNFLCDFYNFKKLFGTGMLSLDVKSSGDSALTIKQNLTGNIAAKIYNGYFSGMNILALLNPGGENTINSITSNNSDFASLSATANIKNAVIRNDDFYMNTPVLNINGNGTINIITMQINYTLSIKDKNNKTLAPLAITGNINNPTVNINAISAIKNIIENKTGGVLDVIHDTLKGGGDGIKKIFGG